MNESIGDNGGVYNRGGRGFPDVSAMYVLRTPIIAPISRIETVTDKFLLD